MRVEQKRTVGMKGKSTPKEKEKIMGVSEAFTQALMNATTDLAYLIDIKGILLAINKAAARRRRKSVKELIGTNIFDYFPPDVAALRKVHTAEIIRTGKPVRFEDRQNGMSFYSSVYPVFDEQGKVQQLAVFVQDITARKKAEEDLQKSENRFCQIAENAREWIWEVDNNGLYTYSSSIVKKMLGYKPEEIVGKKYFYDLFHPKDREVYRKAAFEVFTKKQCFREFINCNAHKDGATAWLSTSGVPMLDEKGNLLGYRGADIDITERKRMEGLLKKSESDLRKQKLALERKNVALMEVIAQIELGKEKLKEELAANVDKLLMPLLNKMKTTDISRKYVDLLRHNLEKLTSPFGRRIGKETFKLTPREIEICNMIESGLKTKEIANLLSVSLVTIKKHRENIRRKLEITKKGINLVVYLQNLQTC